MRQPQRGVELGLLAELGVLKSDKGRKSNALCGKEKQWEGKVRLDLSF